MFIEAKDGGSGGDNWSYGAISRSKLQSNHHHQKNQHPVFLQTRCPSCRPTKKQCQSTEGNISYSLDLFTPSSPGVFGLPTLSLTTNSSWLPWGRFAMPLISPLMPVPHNSGSLTVKYAEMTSWDQQQLTTSDASQILSIDNFRD